MSLARLLFAASVTSLALVSAQECPPRPLSQPQIKALIRDITFNNDSLLPQEDEERIVKLARAIAIDRNAPARDISIVADEIAERTRASFQNQGHFKAEVSADAVEKAEEPGQYDITVSVRQAGPQYRLGEIRFANATYFPTEQLRDLFPVQRGEIFSRAKVAKGLDELRRLYASQGYVNYTAVPETDFDDESRTANLTINVDEGKQFRLRSVHIDGVAPDVELRMLNELILKSGDLYNPEAFESLFQKVPDLVHNPSPDALDKRLDESNGLIDVVLRLRSPMPCETVGEGSPSDF